MDCEYHEGPFLGIGAEALLDPDITQIHGRRRVCRTVDLFGCWQVRGVCPTQVPFPLMGKCRLDAAPVMGYSVWSPWRIEGEDALFFEGRKE